MKIALGCDHGGYALKERIKKYLTDKRHTIIDCGTDSTESCDYPVYGEAAAKKVASGECARGIVICTTGIGISIAANKVKGVRCALCTDVTMAKLTRQHNDSNVLALGGRTTGLQTALDIVAAWVDTEFEGGRHQRRVDMLDAM